jgi:hypothetical protein
MSKDKKARGDLAKPRANASVSKREFLRGVARAASLGGLGAAGAVLARRAGHRTKAGAGDCSNRGVCPACGEVARCGLPQALLARRAGRAR